MNYVRDGVTLAGMAGLVVIVALAAFCLVLGGYKLGWRARERAIGREIAQHFLAERDGTDGGRR